MPRSIFEFSSADGRHSVTSGKLSEQDCSAALQARLGPAGSRPKRRRARFTLLGTVASIALVCLLEERAYAQCVAADAGTVNCTGFDPDGLTISPPPPPGPDVTLEVAPGAMVNGPFTIDGLSSLTFNNNGQINGNITDQ